MLENIYIKIKINVCIVCKQRKGDDEIVNVEIKGVEKII